MKDWKSPIYACFSPVPEIAHIDGRRCHVFKCLGKSCRYSVRRFLDTGDKGSTSNMRKHMKRCWGEDFINTINDTASLDVARDVAKQYTVNGSITSAFQRKGGAMYSTRPHTRAETRYVLNTSLVG